MTFPELLVLITFASYPHWDMRPLRNLLSLACV
jgi:hypothetical protein